MPRNRNRINVSWLTPEGGSEDPFKWEHVQIEVLMDIREELQKLNALLRCPNFVGIPKTLRTIARKLPAQRPRAGRQPSSTAEKD